LTEILKQLAEFFEEEVDNILENLTKIIEPILMIAIGIVVGFIAIATVMLIYSALQGVS
jgi:type II secretory pathway component PulF